MKRIFSVLLVCMLLCGCTGETSQQTPVTMDTSGKYVLDTTRNEAIIDDAGVVEQSNQ